WYSFFEYETAPPFRCWVGLAQALQFERFAGEGVLHVGAPVGGGLVGVQREQDARAGLVVERPAGPVEFVLLDEAEHVGRPGVRVFVLVGAEEGHGFGLGAELADEERIALGEREELALPVAFPRVNVRGVNDATSAFALLQRVAVEDAGEVVAPVESADDDD